MSIQISTGYNPRPLQRKLHNSLKRFNVIIAHRRFGKTIFCINELIDKALSCKNVNPRYGYIAPFYSQSKSIAWDYLKQYTKNLPNVKYNESELTAILPNLAKIRLFGADNPDALRGLYFDGVIMDEYAQIKPKLFSEVIRPALSERKGFAIFIGTPMGYNQLYDAYKFATDKNEDWFGCTFKASETKIIDEKELNDAKKIMTIEQYDQEFECSFNASILGSYYGRYIDEAEKQGRICLVNYDPKIPVHTAWDIGVGDSTAIWFFQQVGQEVRFIDYYENSGLGLEHYIKLLQSKQYIYGKHYAPHDIMVREFGTGKSRFEMAQSLGINFMLAPKLSLEDGINAVRLTLPYCWFNITDTATGIQALRQYRTDFDHNRQIFRDTPLHDWTSHCADAFRYACVSYRHNAGLTTKSLTSARTLNDFISDYDRENKNRKERI